MTSVRKIIRHWRRGTLLDAVLGKLGIGRPIWLVKWYGTRNADLAARALAAHARAGLAEAESDECWVLNLGDEGHFHLKLNAAFRAAKINSQKYDIDSARNLTEKDTNGLAAIYCGFPDTRKIMECANMIRANSALTELPFEYVSGLDEEYKIFERLDEYSDTHFVSPVLLDDPSPYRLYEESLVHFSQKCGLRDYLDLYQLLKNVVENDIKGDIAEFGSYHGHSGYLIARTLQALGSGKHLYMFDTFEEFPNESLGIDQFWSNTHKVSYEVVRSKLENFDNVTLVKGDFTRTLPESGITEIALGYVDCDSYRGTKYLFDVILDDLLSTGGIIVCEDYGHPALLGSRAAAHESLDNHKGLLRFFSQFSGLYVVAKC